MTHIGVKLAEELNDWYNTEHSLHVLHCSTALMDFYKCLGDWQGGAQTLGAPCQTVYQEYSWLNNEAFASRKEYVACAATVSHFARVGAVPMPATGHPQLGIDR